jgi:GT2 family glycosyltransferase
MNPFSVIIPSRNTANLLSCISAIRNSGETCRIIVVDDGFKPSDALDEIPGPLAIVPGEKPFCFARNVNLGIQEAGSDGVILLNDDALLRTPAGFTKLVRAVVPGRHGIMAAVTNSAGNSNQMRPEARRGSESVHIDPRMVCFVAVYIPRSTIDIVGFLDPRFVGYGMDDDDYCFRIRAAGLQIGIYDGCFVDHASLKSSYRGGPSSGGDFQPNLRRYIEKWGVDNRGKTREQSEWAALFPEEK